MMSGEQIRSIASKFARKARRLGTRPLVIRSRDNLIALRGGTKKIPFLGDYVPEGFYLEEELFVDSSGFGRPGEAAMTQEQFLDKLEIGKGYAIREAGEFQVYVGVYGVNAVHPPKFLASTVSEYRSILAKRKD